MPTSLAKRLGNEVKLSLLADAAACGTCLDARGFAETELLTGIYRGSMEELTDWTIWANKEIVF